MKQIDIGKAYGSLKTLSEMKFPIQKSYKIFELLDLFKLKAEFCMNEEKKTINSYNGEIKQDGSILFTGENKVKDAEKCFFELEELHNMEMELTFVPISIYFDEFNDQAISAIDIMNLKGIINIEENTACR